MRTKSEQLLDIIQDLEQFYAELQMEGRDCTETEAVSVALYELYWLYREIAVYDIDEF